MEKEAAPPGPATSGERTRRRWRRPRLGIASKLLIMLLAVSILSALVVGVVGYRSGRDSLRDSAFDQLTELRQSRAREMTAVISELQDDVVLASSSTDLVEGSIAFNRAFAALADSELPPARGAALSQYYRSFFVPEYEKRAGQEIDPRALIPTEPAQRWLQAYYTAPFENPDEALQLDDAGDGSEWSAVSSRYQRFFRKMVTRLGYEDVLLLDTKGNVVYTAYSAVDLGTNILSGPYRGSNLDEAYQRALASNEIDYAEMTDFSRYQPSFGIPSAFVLSPVGSDGRVTGVLAVQLPLKTFSDLLTGDGEWEKDGLGETGEVYVVGEDRLMRSDSRLLIRTRKSSSARSWPREHRRTWRRARWR